MISTRIAARRLTTGGNPEYRTKVEIDLPGLWSEDQLLKIARDMLPHLEISLPYGGQIDGGELVVVVYGEVPEQ